MQSLCLYTSLVLAAVKPVAGVVLQRHELGGYFKHGNICIDGKLLPELYLLGAPRAGTTTLSYDLMKAGVHVATDKSEDDMQKTLESTESFAQSGKEWHFLDRWVLWGHGENQDGERAAWLKMLPDCPADQNGPRTAPRKVLADFTPSYFRMVPLPNGARPAADRLGRKNVEARGFKAGSEHLLAVPETLQKFYGPERSAKITFVTLLRQPLERMQSNWYIDKHLPAPAKFEDAVKASLAELKLNPPQYNEWIWSSMYSYGFDHWLKLYDAKQFVVILSKNYRQDRRHVCRLLQSRMEADLGCLHLADSHLNPQKHPSLKEDLSEGSRQAIAEVFTAERKRLASILAHAHLDGTTLHNYEGGRGDATGVEAWLEAGW
mmetsp:Transcript_31439/g.71790  ORF Transcript_31439/g.71790 Transcript_31439/m.71790 type:complete len:377 (-) Transcript_31439:39-1169(-)